MEISSATATALGEKLAKLDLSEAEGALLTILLSDDDDDEVEGFRQPPTTNISLNFEEIKVTYRPSVLGPLPGAWKVEKG